MKEEQYKEGATTKAIEKQTSKIPSDIFLFAAIAAMGVSLGFKLTGRKHTALFVGQWVAPFLLFGVYNKMVKQSGHDMNDNGDENVPTMSAGSNM